MAWNHGNVPGWSDLSTAEDCCFGSSWHYKDPTKRVGLIQKKASSSTCSRHDIANQLLPCCFDCHRNSGYAWIGSANFYLQGVSKSSFLATIAHWEMLQDMF